MNLPKSLIRYSKKIADYSDERSSDSGIHIAYVNGFKSYTDMLGCVHGDVVDTIAEAVSHVRAAVPCDCADCEGR